jgi:uncharacterized damage-inducible protein DinB
MDETTSPRAADLAARLQHAADDLIAVVERIDDRRWRHVANPGVWSIGKDAEHVAEATVFHQWIVRLTIGEKVSSRRPAIERKQMTSDHSPSEMVALISQRTEEGVRLLRGLTEEQLDRETRPPRARGQRLAETIALVLIGHYHGHRAEIEAKLSALE